MVLIKRYLFTLFFAAITLQSTTKPKASSSSSSSGKLPDSANTKVKGTSSESSSESSAKEYTSNSHTSSSNHTVAAAEAPSASVGAAIRFIGWPHAVTSATATEALTLKSGQDEKSLGNDAGQVKITELHYTAGVQNNGAQILYRKMVPVGDPSVSLVSVVLHNADLPAGKTAVAILFDKQFDMMTQTCSCYWINAPDVIQAVPNLQASEKYFIQFVDMMNPTPKVNVRSGYFAIKP
ncbi:hypothetical protein CONCODRAFT_8498 [Conidiobolus coronatus NRRL 28638]|uniref:Uncharacterized protein n=1 Tax=Conidiobolus coronatus (strain ATCC 28846 / CBS 209.66 / NRRL 28638) TaxID=796925 RepID=A0A137P266_CONC2|nr:hypothetical protein CONCODRAFT_8498 [Conidiobolus coronatus NRRL 28638]|eukprot:KXN69112.1 hypothetical protein CONCODRAFT_8498 [Conidiobolus coronatus NRRL 28638]